MKIIVIEAAIESLKHQLQEFALELLAAIVLIAIFMAMTDPREDW